MALKNDRMGIHTFDQLILKAQNLLGEIKLINLLLIREM